MGKTVICKLVYFSDFNHYEIYEKPITNETYIKFERDPLSKHFLDSINITM
ncbi:type II toxin-antitoxin system antitoxin SocA domain-containing protein [Methanosphaera stadtmanae]|uniref:type II toxin-antitoxin system antitoxin SocA domain-containing protein n=1 Tax=Methanosphaera stadtmanae TaxID=2317 RepID=UPI002666D7FD|nr:type II toxin-antitoxin system antitoxin SocA domain-containing protein [Methanosphaera stadtmanae]